MIIQKPTLINKLIKRHKGGKGNNGAIFTKCNIVKFVTFLA